MSTCRHAGRRVEGKNRLWDIMKDSEETDKIFFNAGAWVPVKLNACGAGNSLMAAAQSHTHMAPTLWREILRPGGSQHALKRETSV